jgi:hypothetical protein
MSLSQTGVEKSPSSPASNWRVGIPCCHRRREIGKKVDDFLRFRLRMANPSFYTRSPPPRGEDAPCLDGERHAGDHVPDDDLGVDGLNTATPRWFESAGLCGAQMSRPSDTAPRHGILVRVKAAVRRREIPTELREPRPSSHG